MGSSHIYKDVSVAINRIFDEFKPEMLLIELDQERCDLIVDIIDSGLIDEEKPDIDKIRSLFYSNKNYLPNIKEEDVKEEDINLVFLEKIRDFQWKLGKEKGIIPGNEFITAIKLAIKNEIPIELIDFSFNNILELLKKVEPEQINNFMNEMLFNDENENIDGIKEEYEELMRNINNPEYLTKAIESFKDESPDIFEIFIGKRDRNMTERIWDIYHQNLGKRMLVLVGAGHFKGIIDILKEFLLSNK